MNDKSDNWGEPVHDGMSDTGSDALSLNLRAALRARYESVIQEPLPDTLAALLQDIRSAENKRR